MERTSDAAQGDAKWLWRLLLLSIITLSLLIVFIVALWVGILVWNYFTATTTDDIKNMLQEGVPRGTTAEDALAFLDSEGIEHGAPYSARSSSTLLDAGFPPETEVIGAIVRNTSTGFLYDIHINFWLVLDDEGRVAGYHIEELYDGL
jgi:hypothetical protein